MCENLDRQFERLVRETHPRVRLDCENDSRKKLWQQTKELSTRSFICSFSFVLVRPLYFVHAGRGPGERFDR